jgi:hypothetical protein
LMCWPSGLADHMCAEPQQPIAAVAGRPHLLEILSV